MKLKIKASTRIAERYLLLEASGKKEVNDILIHFLGVFGMSEAMPHFIEIWGKDDLVLAVNRKSIDSVRAAFELSKDKIKVLRVSGTLKGLRK